MSCESVELTHYSSRWNLGEDGVYRDSEFENISYPAEGNDQCFRLEDDSFWFQHRNEIILSLTRRFASGRVLFDVGGGNGCVAKYLQDNGERAVLVEPGARGVANGVARGVANVVHSMWSEDVVRPGAAAAVGLFDVVEHIENDVEFLRSIRATLSDGGKLLLTVPALMSIWSFDDKDAGHFRRYRLSRLLRLIREAGFIPEYSSYFFSALPIPIFLCRTVPTLLRVRQKREAGATAKEHVPRKGVTTRLLEKTLAWEKRRIARGSRIPFGSSCVAVARKAS